MHQWDDLEAALQSVMIELLDVSEDKAIDATEAAASWAVDCIESFDVVEIFRRDPARLRERAAKKDALADMLEEQGRRPRRAVRLRDAAIRLARVASEIEASPRTRDAGE
jgi:hypothetical protein